MAENGNSAGGITHREAIAALPPAMLAELRVLSDAPGLRHLALHVAAIGLTGLAIAHASTVWLLVPLLIVHGVLLTFLFTAQHECIHGTAFHSPLLNVAVADAIGLLTFLPARWFRYFHLAHHRHTQDPQHDPELAAPKPRGWRAYAWALTGFDRWRSMAVTMFALTCGRQPDAFVPPKAHGRIRLEARIYVFIYAAIAGLGIAAGWSWLVWLWLLPSLLGQPFLRAYLMAEHTACPLVPDMLLNTRTTFASPLINWLAWNMPNHTAHHAVPTVPFHRLPELTGVLRQSLKSTADGYLHAHRQIIAAWQDRPTMPAGGDTEIASKQP